MAKNLTSRVRKIFRPMKTEETDPIINPTDNPVDHPHEESLPEGHNPDIGEPEEKTEAPQPVSEEEKWKESASEWRDKYMRLYAEFDNFRKRSQKERVELLQTASSDIIRELLPILDDFDRAIKANETVEDIVVVKEGFTLIHNKLYKKLESKGLKPLNAKGEPFDTDFHEAITQIPSPDPSWKGKIIDEVEKGYTLHDKVIRFSKVIIGQ